jgi:hypothetical protein
MQLLNHAVRHVTDGFIGILDMFGFEDSKPSQLEQLCINLSSETMQHFYNTHIFKSSIESCRDEGIASDVVIDYIDNVPCIDLISSLVSKKNISRPTFFTPDLEELKEFFSFYFVHVVLIFQIAIRLF